VWKAERQAIEERKRIEEKRKERAESRRAEELQRLQDAAKGKTAVQKVEWIYAPVATDSVKISPERETYLLGTSKTTKVVLNVGCVGVGTGNREGHDSFKDTINLVREDHLLPIKNEELTEEKRSQQMASEIKSVGMLKDEVERYRTDDRNKHNLKRKGEEKDVEEHSHRARRQRNEHKRN